MGARGGGAGGCEGWGSGEDEGRVLEEAPPTEPHLQLSQIISAREVRGGEMSKYLNKFHRSLLRAGRCGEGAGGGARGAWWGGRWGHCWRKWGGEGMRGLGNKKKK